MPTMKPKGVYSPRIKDAAGPRATNLTLRMYHHELKALVDLGERYAAAKGLPSPVGKTAMVRLGIKRLMKSYPPTPAAKAA